MNGFPRLWKPVFTDAEQGDRRLSATPDNAADQIVCHNKIAQADTMNIPTIILRYKLFMLLTDDNPIFHIF